jgi:hypothetical protein
MYCTLWGADQNGYKKIWFLPRAMPFKPRVAVWLARAAVSGLGWGRDAANGECSNVIKGKRKRINKLPIQIAPCKLSIYKKQVQKTNSWCMHDRDSPHKCKIKPPPGRAKTGECICTVKWIWESLQSGVCDWNENGFVKRTRFSAQLFWGSACNVMIHWREGKKGDVD